MFRANRSTIAIDWVLSFYLMIITEKLSVGWFECLTVNSSSFLTKNLLYTMVPIVFLVNVEKSGSSKRLKWLPEWPENLLIQLVAALFLVIFVLIGVIIWLSVSIHLSNRDSLRTISTAVDLLKGQNGQNVNTKPSEPCSTDAPQTGQSRAIPCDTLFRATFEFT